MIGIQYLHWDFYSEIATFVSDVIDTCTVYTIGLVKFYGKTDTDSARIE